MTKLLREPFLHFLLLGAGLFALHEWRERTRPAAAAPSRIEVDANVIERLRAGYQRQFNHAPDEAELQGLVATHIREEVLYREALAMGLDRDDTIVRRRLAQKMEFLTHDMVGAAEPVESELKAYFEKEAARYSKPARLSFRHVYFSREKRGDAAETAAREALAALENGANDETMGDAFLHGFDFFDRSVDEISALFGSEFATPVTVQATGDWRGPVPSSYGLHLVRVEARGEARPVALSEVRESVQRDWEDERRRAANQEVFEKLRERYSVIVDEAALKTAAALTTAQR